MPHASLDSVHSRNVMLVKLIWFFLFFNLCVEAVLYLGKNVWDSDATLAGALIGLVLILLVIKKMWIRLTMYLICFGLFAYMALVIMQNPSVVNIFFMWLLVPLCTLYQEYIIVIIAGVLNSILSSCFFITVYKEVFALAAPIDYVFLIMCNFFMIIFFIFAIRFNRKLQEQAEENERRLNNILDSTGMVSWAHDLKTNTMTISDNMQELTGYAAQMFADDPDFYKMVVHPDDLPMVEDAKARLAKGAAMTYEHRITTAAGKTIWVENRAGTVKDAYGESIVVEGFLSDCTKKKQKEEKVVRLAYYDSLTGLPNLTNFRNQAEELLANCDNCRDIFGLLFIDLDEFKNVNDTLGHDAGNEVLCHVAQRLTRSLRDNDVVCRMFGDEFMVLLPGADKTMAQQLSDRIRRIIEEPYAITGGAVRVSCSIGISLYPEHGREIAELINRADNAMYGVKSGGKNDCGVFEVTAING